LMDCNYAEGVVHDDTGVDLLYWEVTGGGMPADDYEPLDPFGNEDQRQALLEWFKVDCIFLGDKWSSQKSTLSNKNFHKGGTRKEAENACLKACLEEEG